MSESLEEIAHRMHEAFKENMRAKNGKTLKDSSLPPEWETEIAVISRLLNSTNEMIFTIKHEASKFFFEMQGHAIQALENSKWQVCRKAESPEEFEKRQQYIMALTQLWREI